jgi:hypothetical protein
MIATRGVRVAKWATASPPPHSIGLKAIDPTEEICIPGIPLQMRALQIASVGETPDAIFVGVREFPVSRLILLFTPEFHAPAQEVARRAAAIKLDVVLRPLENEPLLGCLKVVSEIVRDEGANFEEIIVNTGGGPRMMTCSLLAAAFVNGVRAIDVVGDCLVALPVLKFSYFEVVGATKLKVLRTLETMSGEASSLDDLAAKTGLQKSLLSYHIRGGRRGKGLAELSLVVITRRTRGRLDIRLTPTGRLLLIGNLPDPLGTQEMTHPEDSGTPR